MKKRFNWLWQFTKVVLGTALIDGLLTGTYFAVLRKIPDYLLFGLLYAFVYHIWFILAAGLLLAGVSGVFPRSVGSLSGLLIAGALIGGLIPYLINTQLSAGLTVETLLFTAVGCSWGYLYWRLISNPAQTKV